MTAQMKMSHTGKVSKRHPVFWGVAVLILVVLVGGYYTWHNRYHLLEHKVRQVFAKNGFQVELNIISADGNNMVAKNIHLSSGSVSVLDMPRLELEYDIANALKGEFERVVMVRPHIRLTLDETGKVINDWLPTGSRNSRLVFPHKGVEIEEALLDWQAPFGQGKTLVSVEAKSAVSWALIYDSPETVIKKDGLTLLLDVKGGAEQIQKDKVEAFGTVNATAMETPALAADSMQADYRLNFEKLSADKILTQGWMNVQGEGTQVGETVVDKFTLKLDLDTEFDPKLGVFETYSSQWKLQAEAVSLFDKVNRKKFAERLTSYQALRNTPIAEQFAALLPRKLENLLTEFSLQGEGHITINKDGYKLDLTDVLTLKNKSQQVDIFANENEVVQYEKLANLLKFDVDVDWGGSHPIGISNLKMQASSVNGMGIETVKNVNAQLSTQVGWRVKTGSGISKLSPFSIGLDYLQGEGRQKILLSGAIEYTGAVPGGIVRDLRAEGVVTTRISGTRNENFRLGFAPKTDIYIGTFTNLSGWQAKDVIFAMPVTENLIRTGRQGREMSVNLQNVDTQIVSPTQDRHMDIHAANVHVKTVLAAAPQVWNLAITDAEFRSDDFPSPGTHIRSPASQLRLEQNQDGYLYFTSDNPGAFIETDNVLVENIDVKLEGIPDKFNARYEANRVEFKGGDVPILPVKGTATYDKGELKGEAVATLKAGYRGEHITPIDVAFTSVNGRGKVKIHMGSIHFTPTGLQPQFLISSLKGKLAEVSGDASASFDLEFGGGEKIKSYGTTNLINLDMGTLVGPIQGVNAQLKFSSLFPLKTDGLQFASLSGFDPGFPLDGGQISFELIPGGVRIDEAVWPIENDVDNPLDNGRIYIEPMLWKFGNVENLAAAHIENLELATVFEKIGRNKVSMTGKVSGVLPARINGVDVVIEGGKLEVTEGGVIKFNTDSAGAAGQENEYAGHGLKALENLTYKKLEALIDGPLDGSVKLNIVASGYNPDVLNGQKFLFDVGIEGELANIGRNLSKSFSSQENIKRVLDLQAEPPK